MELTSSVASTAPTTSLDSPSNECAETAEAMLPDAPIHQLLSLRHNPKVVDMSQEQLRSFVAQLRTLTSPATLAAKLRSDSDKIKPRKEKSELQKLRDSI